MPSNGERKTWLVSKSSGNARDRNILSRSLPVRRFNLARLRHLAGRNRKKERSYPPILKPYLNLTRTQTGDLFRQTFAGDGIGMSLTREFAHQIAGLIVGEAIPVSTTTLSIIKLAVKTYRNRFIFLFSCFPSGAKADISSDRLLSGTTVAVDDSEMDSPGWGWRRS